MNCANDYHHSPDNVSGTLLLAIDERKQVGFKEKSSQLRADGWGQCPLTCVCACQVKYKEGWQKTRGKGFEMKLDAMSLLAAKASGELASSVGFSH